MMPTTPMHLNRVKGVDSPDWLRADSETELEREYPCPGGKRFKPPGCRSRVAALCPGRECGIAQPHCRGCIRHECDVASREGARNGFRGDVSERCCGAKGNDLRSGGGVKVASAGGCDNERRS